MAITFKITGMMEVNNMLRNLPTETQKGVGTCSEEFCKGVIKMAKRRAPVWSGQLKKSIKFEKKGVKSFTISVESPYGAYQEYGFRPHYVQLFRSTRAGGVVGDWAADKGLSPTKNSIFVSGKAHPFITPAVEYELAKLQTRLSRAMDKSIRRAAR